MWYEWDDAKDLANRLKHGVSFQEVLAFQWDTALEVADARMDYGEPRWAALGLIGQRLHTLIFTEREGAIRVISLRKANHRERKAYGEKQNQT